MKIAIVAAIAGDAGGAETYQQTVIAALRRRGHDVGVLHETRAPETPSTDMGPGPRWCVADSSADQVLDELRAWSPDVVYQQGTFSPDLERRLLDAFPCVLFAHSYYGTCPTGTKRHTVPRFHSCTRTIGPGCLWLHWPRRCGGLDPRTALRDYRRQMDRRQLLERYAAILVASHHMRTEYDRHVDARLVHLTPLPPSGVEPDPEPPLPRPFRDRILFAGRLTALKGLGLLIDALPLAERTLGRSLTLIVAGEGPERNRLQAASRRRNINADFLGWVSAERRNAILREVDLVAVPSLWPEPFGLIGVEAGCAGVPAVANDVGGIGDWLTAGRSGELAAANPPRPPALADAIVKCLQDPEHYHRLCRGAWDTARRFSLESHVDLLERIFSDATATRVPTGHDGE